MSVRVLTNANHSAETRGGGIVLKFRVIGSKFGPVEIELDTNEAEALIGEIQGAIDAADDLALAALGKEPGQ